ncbi:hypothetical protein HHI36_002321 [Cryptolaemus montrouzieri]|uniref:Uncharacterized protein n=1 Tax=Cryptolaemus montrouzieri TaxID=559131 RepID=A0ABD2PA96_9CUCU
MPSLSQTGIKSLIQRVMSIVKSVCQSVSYFSSSHKLYYVTNSRNISLILANNRKSKMAPSYDEVLDICRVLSEQEQLNVTLKEAGKGFVLAGTGAAIGTLLGGPVGLFIGGTLGSATAAYVCKGQCKSLVHIIQYDMTPVQKERLAASVTHAIQKFRAEDLTLLLPLVLKSEQLKGVVIQEMVTFFAREMQLAVTSS